MGQAMMAQMLSAMGPQGPPPGQMSVRPPQPPSQFANQQPAPIAPPPPTATPPISPGLAGSGGFINKKALGTGYGEWGPDMAAASPDYSQFGQTQPAQQTGYQTTPSTENSMNFAPAQKKKPTAFGEGF